MAYIKRRMRQLTVDRLQEAIANKMEKKPLSTMPVPSIDGKKEDYEIIEDF